MSYTEKEVRGLLDAYLELSSKRTRPYIGVRLMDLSIAMKRLHPPYREAAFFGLVAQMTLREAGEYLGISHTRVADRIRFAIDELLVMMNGR